MARDDARGEDAGTRSPGGVAYVDDDSADDTGPAGAEKAGARTSSGRRRSRGGGPAGGGPGPARMPLDTGPSVVAAGPRGPVDRRRALTRIGMVAAAIGVVVALLALPFIGAVGLFAKSSADHFLGLPAGLVTPPLPQSSKILAADGSVVATLSGAENRVLVDGNQIPRVMREAIVAIEDARFYQHNGVDPQGVLRAAARNSEAGDVTQGGSTLTQQYVKNVLLQDARTAEERETAAGNSLDRKIQELRYAVELEKRLTKDEILERYLNIAYFGDGAYGIGTAAEHYFGIPVSDVTLDQAALLAGLVQSPSRYDPVNNPDAAITRRNVVLDRMASKGYITPTQASAAQQLPLNVIEDQPTVVDSCETSVAPFFCDYVRTQLRRNPALGETVEERDRRIYEGGLVIQSTLNPQVQQAAQAAVNSTIPPDNRVSATEVVIQPGTGDILAMAVNRAYGTDEAANQTKVALPTEPTFQPGSTFKTFTMVAALEAGYGTSTAFYSPACYETSAYPLDRGEGECPKGYSNADPAEVGIYNLQNGTWDSVNTFYIQLQEKIGVPAVVEMATRIGVAQEHLADISPAKGDVTIGGEYVSPMDMALSYATLAAGGIRCEARFAMSATDSSQKQVEIGGAPQCERVLAQGIADTATSVLAGVITRGTGGNARIGRPAAGKTGTNDGYSSAWFVGYTPQIAAAVAVGDPRGAVANPLRNVVADGRTWSRVFGGDLPALIWGRSIKAALADQPVEQLPNADPTVARGQAGKSGLLNTPPPAPTPTLPTPGDVVDDLLDQLGQPGQQQPGQTQQTQPQTGQAQQTQQPPAQGGG